MEIRIKDEFIKLGQALKLAGVVEDGVEAKYAINDGLVLVNGEVENRRGRKIHPGDTISYDGKDIYVIREPIFSTATMPREKPTFWKLFIWLGQVNPTREVRIGR